MCAAARSYDALREHQAFQEGLHTCGVCLEERRGAAFVRLDACRHAWCQGCLAEQARIHVAEGGLERLRWVVWVGGWVGGRVPGFASGGAQGQRTSSGSVALQVRPCPGACPGRAAALVRCRLALNGCLRALPCCPARCPDPQCGAPLSPAVLRRLLAPADYERWEALTLQRTLDTMPGAGAGRGGCVAGLRAGGSVAARLLLHAGQGPACSSQGPSTSLTSSPQGPSTSLTSPPPAPVRAPRRLQTRPTARAAAP